MYSLCGTPVSLERRSLHGVPVSLKFQPHERLFSIFLCPVQLVKWACTDKIGEMARSAVIPTIDHSKPYRSRRHEQSIPPPMKNERHMPNTPTETRAIQSRTQTAKPYSELAISDLHRIPESYIPVNRGSLHFPAAADSPGWMRWSPEDGEGGLRRVLLPRPLVRRKAIIKSTHTMWYSPLVKPERNSKAKRRFLIK